MESDDDDRVVVRCTRRADLAVTQIPSDKGNCHVCGAGVWVDAQLPKIIERRFKGRRQLLICMHCELEPGHEVKIINTPEQVLGMRQSGMTDVEIAYAFAMGEVCGGKGTLDDTEAEILANPTGLKGQAFLKAFRTAQVTVALTRSRKRN